jgi:hypothetical protein
MMMIVSSFPCCILPVIHTVDICYISVIPTARLKVVISKEMPFFSGMAKPTWLTRNGDTQPFLGVNTPYLAHCSSRGFTRCPYKGI